MFTIKPRITAVWSVADGFVYEFLKIAELDKLPICGRIATTVTVRQISAAPNQKFDGLIGDCVMIGQLFHQPC